MSSADGSTLLAVEYQGGVFRSVDGGLSWYRLTNGLPATADWMTCATSLDGNYLTVAAYGAGIYYSRDGGQSFALSNVPPSTWVGMIATGDGALVAAVAPRTWSRQLHNMKEWLPGSVRSMFSTEADELIVSRALLGAILGVDMLSTFDYDGVKIWLVNSRGGMVSVTVRKVNGLQVSLNTGSLPVLISFLIRAGIDSRNHMVLGLIPGADGKMPVLKRKREVAEDEQQDIKVGVLPAAITLTHAAAVKLAEDKAKELLALAKTTVLEAERAYWATADAESKAVAAAAVRRAMRNLERIPRVVALYNPDFARAFVVEINECKPWNARFPRHPGFRDVEEGEGVGVITQNGRVLYARPTWSWGLSFNLCCVEFQNFLEEADIYMGDHVACVPVPIENVPDEERLTGVNHYFMIYKVPAPQVSKEAVLDLWCDLKVGAAASLPAHDAAVDAVLRAV